MPFAIVNFCSSLEAFIFNIKAFECKLTEFLLAESFQNGGSNLHSIQLSHHAHQQYNE